MYVCIYVGMFAFCVSQLKMWANYNIYYWNHFARNVLQIGNDFKKRTNVDYIKRCVIFIILATRSRILLFESVMIYNTFTRYTVCKCMVEYLLKFYVIRQFFFFKKEASLSDINVTSLTSFFSCIFFTVVDPLFINQRHTICTR